MKIAIVNSFYSSNQPSGENDFVKSLQTSLQAAGHEVLLVALNTDELSQSRFYKFQSAISVASGFGHSPVKQLMAFNPDVVHVHNLFPNWATNWLQHWNGPIVSTVHNFRPFCAAGTLFRDGKVCLDCIDGSALSGVFNSCYRDSKIATLPITIQNIGGLKNNKLFSASQKVLFPSLQAMEFYISMGMPPEKCIYLPGTVADIGFDANKPAGASWIYIGRLTVEKGIKSLLANWPLGIPLVIYGDGPLKEEVINSSNSSISYGGRLEKSEVPSALAMSKGLIFPSEWFEGGTPLVYLEALASGRPVIALAGNSVATDIRSKSTGIVFSEWSSLRDALGTNEEMLTEISARNRAVFKETYSNDSFVSGHVSAYEDAIEGFLAIKHASLT